MKLNYNLHAHLSLSLLNYCHAMIAKDKQKMNYGFWFKDNLKNNFTTFNNT